MAQNVEIRVAGADEEPALADLRYRWESTASSPESLGDFTDGFLDWLRKNRHTHVPLVAVLGGRVVGMAWLVVVERVPSPGRPSRRSGELQACYVAPEFRGRGIGLSLSRAVLEEAGRRELEFVTLEAEPAAVPMYARAGFRRNDRLLWAPVEAGWSRSAGPEQGG